MAVNRDSNGYTFGFAIALVVVVGTVLALLASGLKDRIGQNDKDKKQLDILSAFIDLDAEKISRKNVKEAFNKYVKLDKCVVIDVNGEVREGVEPMSVDVQRQYRDKNLKVEDKNYPLFVAEKDGKTVYVVPVVGKGLWGPIWGNICLSDDMNTISGASFGHKGETPGLGAEITQSFFINRWIGENLANEEGTFTNFKIVKDGTGSQPKNVDGITGGTITSKGVEGMMNETLAIYVKYFNKIKKG